MNVLIGQAIGRILVWLGLTMWYGLSYWFPMKDPKFLKLVELPKISPICYDKSFIAALNLSAENLAFIHTNSSAK